MVVHCDIRNVFYLTFHQDWMEVDTSCGNFQCHSTNSKSKCHQSVTCDQVFCFLGERENKKKRMPDRSLINQELFFWLYSGFVRVLENLESHEILLWHFPTLESPGKRPLIPESSGNLLNSTKKYEVYGRHEKN